MNEEFKGAIVHPSAIRMTYPDLITLLGLDFGKAYLSIREWWKLKVSIVYLLSWAKRIWPEEFEDV